MTNDSWAPSAGKSTLHLFTLNMAASCARAAAGPPRALQHERGIFDGVVLIMVVILVKVSHCACFFFCSCGALRHHPVSRKPKGLQQTAYLAPCVQPSAKTLFYVNIFFLR